jgi:hypothetical protein
MGISLFHQLARRRIPSRPAFSRNSSSNCCFSSRRSSEEVEDIGPFKGSNPFSMTVSVE